MSENDRGKLASFLTDVINWNWYQFCKAEEDPQYTGYQSAVFSLVRACSEAKLGAIKLAVDRVDGKLATPLKIEYPKVWFRYPYAEEVAPLPPGASGPRIALPPPESLPVPTVTTEPATLTLRETLNKMADQPKETVPLILKVKQQIEEIVRADKLLEDSELAKKKIPQVKSVIAANLLYLATHKNNFEAITEVFDQIDGKLVETIKILSDDVYLTQYALQAPATAVKNEEGVYVIEATAVAEEWKKRLKVN